VLAAEEDAAQVDVLDALPGLEVGLQDRAVVGGVDAGVVHQHVDATELLAGLGEGGADLLLVGDVGSDRQRPDRLLGVEVDADDRGTLGGEEARRGGADPARGPGDHADLVLQPRRHGQPSSVA
jgi:hypothetical protein